MTTFLKNRHIHEMIIAEIKAIISNPETVYPQVIMTHDLVLRALKDKKYSDSDIDGAMDRINKRHGSSFYDGLALRFDELSEDLIYERLSDNKSVLEVTLGGISTASWTVNNVSFQAFSTAPIVIYEQRNEVNSESYIELSLHAPDDEDEDEDESEGEEPTPRAKSFLSGERR